jgi:hypothetical protein
MCPAGLDCAALNDSLPDLQLVRVFRGDQVLIQSGGSPSEPVGA